LYGYEKLMLLCGLIVFALPVASRAALARACVMPGRPQKAQAHVDAVFRLNPHVGIRAAVLHAARAGSRAMEH
jgi:class 3 adenylate cyclase